MQTFKNNEEQEFTLHITISVARSIGHQLGLDLLHPQQNMRLLSSLTERLAWIELLCEEQCRREKISLEDFEKGLEGPDYVFNASQAFVKEVADFLDRMDLPEMASLARNMNESHRIGREKLDSMTKDGSLDSLMSEAMAEMMEIALGKTGKSSIGSEQSADSDQPSRTYQSDP